MLKSNTMGSHHKPLVVMCNHLKTYSPIHFVQTSIPIDIDNPWRLPKNGLYIGGVWWSLPLPIVGSIEVSGVPLNMATHHLANVSI
jgi:hypothetical protein